MFHVDRGEHWKVCKWIDGTVERRATIKAASESALPRSFRAGFKPRIVYSWSVDPGYQAGDLPQVPPKAQIEEAKYVGTGAVPFGSPARNVARKGEFSGLAVNYELSNARLCVGSKANESKPLDPSEDNDPDELGPEYDGTPPPVTSKTTQPKDGLRKSSSAPKPGPGFVAANTSKKQTKINPVAQNPGKTRREAAKINVFASKKTSATEKPAKRKPITDLRDDVVQNEEGMKTTRKGLRRTDMKNVNKKRAVTGRA
jgi:hypothetical protein